MKADVTLAKNVHAADVKRLQQESGLVQEELEGTKHELRDAYGQITQLRQEVEDVHEELSAEKRAHEDTQNEVSLLL